MTEKFNERSAGVWFAMGFYMIGGGYLLAFWGILDTAAYHLAILGVTSIAIGVTLYLLSRWAFWLGLFTFPVYLVQFIYALSSSVNLVGWSPDLATGAFQASMIIYLAFLCFSFILLIDKRNTLRNDRALETLGKLASPNRPEESAT